MGDGIAKTILLGLLMAVTIVVAIALIILIIKLLF